MLESDFVFVVCASTISIDLITPLQKFEMQRCAKVQRAYLIPERIRTCYDFTCAEDVVFTNFE